MNVATTLRSSYDVFKLRRLQTLRSLNLVVTPESTPDAVVQAAITSPLQLNINVSHKRGDGWSQHTATLNPDNTSNQAIYKNKNAPAGARFVCTLSLAGREGFPTEVFPWVQGWGSEVQVLAPSILRERWLADARQIINANSNQATYDAE